MYSNQLAIAIKHNGKILRETKDMVHIPFGSEFSVLVKNLNSRRVKFTLSIDGANALDDTEIIVNANSEVEIKRFIRSGNMNEGNAFKFIERTQSIEDGPRGIKVDDGVVRVEFWFEKEVPQTTYHTHVHADEYYRKYITNNWGPTYRNYGDLIGTYGQTNISATGGSLSSNSIAGSVACSATYSADASDMSVSLNDAMAKSPLRGLDQEVKKQHTSIPVNDVGITVPGSKVEQKFTTVYGFNSEPISNVLILRLVGMSGDTVVTKPITVAAKPKCSTCGRLNKASSNFCTSCGTALTLL